MSKTKQQTQKHYRTDHDVLICIEERLGELKTQFSNHLRHHWAITIACLTAGIVGMLNFAIAMFVILSKS